jgi:transposase-like protein
MPRRRVYSPAERDEICREIVEMLLTMRTPQVHAELRKRYGISKDTALDWVREARAWQRGRSALSVSEAQGDVRAMLQLAFVEARPETKLKIAKAYASIFGCREHRNPVWNHNDQELENDAAAIGAELVQELAESQAHPALLQVDSSAGA